MLLLLAEPPRAFSSMRLSLNEAYHVDKPLNPQTPKPLNPPILSCELFSPIKEGTRDEKWLEELLRSSDPAAWCRVQGLRFRIQGSGFRAYGSGLGVQSLGFRALGLGFRALGFWVQGLRFNLQGFRGLGFRALGLGFRVQYRV